MCLLNLHKQYLNETLDERGNPVRVTFNVPERFNFAYDVVDKLGKETPDRRAMLWVSNDGDERTYTFSDISRESDRAAAMLLAHGIKKGDKVMLVLKRHFEFWPAVLACHKIGAVAIPATNQLAAKDILYRLNAASVAAVVCTDDGGFTAHVDGAEKDYGKKLIKFVVHGNKDGWLSYADEIERAPAFIKPAEEDLPRNEDAMLLYFTSGTTGMPKMVVHDFTYPIGHIVTAKYWHKVDPDGLHLTISETGWAKSVWGKLYGQWFMEAGIFVFDFERFDPEILLPMFGKYRITTFCAPPTMFRFFIKEDLSKYDFSSLQHVTIAGEALNPEVYEQFRRATGCTLYEGYGQTETTLTVLNSYWMTPCPGSMGRPSPAYDVDIVDESGTPTIPGVTGEIVLRLPERGKPTGLFMGYYRDKELTDSVWHDGYYHTGDTAWRDEDGYFWYVGRTDDVIKSSGYRIGPFEVESVIMEHPAVLECAVTAAPDPVRGQVVKATIVPAKGYTPDEALKKDIQDYVKSHTAPYKYPRIIEFVPELPKTISGKIKRNEIRNADSKK
jgi:acetyl-CoA synthetase